MAIQCWDELQDTGNRRIPALRQRRLGAVAGAVVRRDAEAAVVQRRARRSRARLAVAAPLGGDGAQRRRRDEPAAGRAGGPRHPEDAAATPSTPPSPTAAMLSLVEPMNVGPGRRPLRRSSTSPKRTSSTRSNASGKAPSGQTLARMNELGYRWDPKNWGPGSGMPQRGILTVTVPGAVWGWDEVLRRFGTMTFKETLQPAIDYAEQGFPVSERIAVDWRLPPPIGPVPAIRAAAARSAIPMRWPPGTWTAARRWPARSSAIPASPAPSASCSSRAATASTRARSRAPSSTSRRSSAAR